MPVSEIDELPYCRWMAIRAIGTVLLIESRWTGMSMQGRAGMGFFDCRRSSASWDNDEPRGHTGMLGQSRELVVDFRRTLVRQVDELR